MGCLNIGFFTTAYGCILLLEYLTVFHPGLGGLGVDEIGAAEHSVVSNVTYWE